MASKMVTVLDLEIAQIRTLQCVCVMSCIYTVMRPDKKLDWLKAMWLETLHLLSMWLKPRNLAGSC